MDKLLRDVTHTVIQCHKVWRFQLWASYDAWEMENATNTTLLTPIARRAWFVKDQDFQAYNTLACVGNLKKDMQAGNMLSEDEILALQVNQNQTNMDGIQKPSRKWLRRQKRIHH